MSTIELTLPDELISEAMKESTQQKEPIDSIVARALEGYFAAQRRYDALIERGKRNGSRERFLAALDAAPNSPPVPGDELES